MIKEVFNNIRELLGYYQFLKYQVVSTPTLLPKSDFGDNCQKFRAKAQQSNNEEKFAFIGTIEKFINYYYTEYQRDTSLKIPIDCLMQIWHFYCCPHLTNFKTLGQLNLYFKKRIARGENIPRRLKYRPHVLSVGRSLKIACEDYFYNLGFIKEKIIYVEENSEQKCS